MNKPLSLSDLPARERKNFKAWCKRKKLKPTLLHLYDYMVATGNDKRINEIQLP